MKRAFYFLLGHGLYHLGDLLSYCMFRGWLYRPYSWCMVKSNEISDAHDLGIWT